MYSLLVTFVFFCPYLTTNAASVVVTPVSSIVSRLNDGEVDHSSTFLCSSSSQRVGYALTENERHANWRMDATYKQQVFAVDGNDSSLSRVHSYTSTVFPSISYGPQMQMLSASPGIVVISYIFYATSPHWCYKVAIEVWDTSQSQRLAFMDTYNLEHGENGQIMTQKLQCWHDALKSQEQENNSDDNYYNCLLIWTWSEERGVDEDAVQREEEGEPRPYHKSRADDPWDRTLSHNSFHEIRVTHVIEYQLFSLRVTNGNSGGGGVSFGNVSSSHVLTSVYPVQMFNDDLLVMQSSTVNDDDKNAGTSLVYAYANAGNIAVYLLWFDETQEQQQGTALTVQDTWQLEADAQRNNGKWYFAWLTLLDLKHASQLFMVSYTDLWTVNESFWLHSIYDTSGMQYVDNDVYGDGHMLGPKVE